MEAAESAVVPFLLFTAGPHSVHNPLRSSLFCYSMLYFRLAFVSLSGNTIVVIESKLMPCPWKGPRVVWSGLWAGHDVYIALHSQHS